MSERQAFIDGARRWRTIVPSEEVIEREADARYPKKPPTDAGGETERARILERRAGFVEGARRWGAALSNAFDAAAKRYPLPPRTRPRVAHRTGVYGSLRIRFDGDVLVYSYSSPRDGMGVNWSSLSKQITRGNESLANDIGIVAEMLHELAANPTEPVPEDEP